MQLLGAVQHWLALAFLAFHAGCPWALVVQQQLAPTGKLASFLKHGADWVQGNCASRAKQSPIDLNEIFKPPGGTFSYKYTEVASGKISVANNGLVIAATMDGQGLPSLGGIALQFVGETKWFNLTSIEVKSQSEHTLRGKHFPLEIQLVHRPPHYSPTSQGPEAVTVSIFVDCINAPEVPAVYPGLLQTKTKPPAAVPRLRGNRTAALLQQTPEADAGPLLPPAGEEADDDDDPAHRKMNAEVNFVRTLVEGSDSLAAASGAPLPGPGTLSTDDDYRPPNPSDVGFNPLLQFLVASEPPELDFSVDTFIGPMTPLRPGSMLEGGTYFYYAGSETLPPCGEKDLWLIKREPMIASTSQVTTLFETVHRMSGGAGNFRTSMPLNQRAVQVLKAEEGIPRQLQPETQIPAPGPGAGSEAKYVEVAKDAIKVASAAADYAKELDWQLSAGAAAHLAALEAHGTTTQKPTTSAFIPKPPDDAIWATNIMSKAMKKAIEKAVKENVEEMVPATASLTISYLRQRVLKQAGFHEPPPGAKLLAPTPIPGVPTFFPPVMQTMPSPLNISQLRAQMIAANCTCSNSTCQNITGFTPQKAQSLAGRYAASGIPGFGCNLASTEEEPLTPGQIAQSLPPGVQPVPASWPDPDAGPWSGGLPPAGCPGSAPACSAWPNPSGPMTAGYTPYQWQRYQWNWQIYQSSYQPYRSTYTGYAIHRRRRFRSSSYTPYSSSSRRRSYRSSYSSSYGSGSRYSRGRRRSYRSSSVRRRSYRRRSYSRYR